MVASVLVLLRLSYEIVGVGKLRLIDDKVENIRDAENAGREGYLLAKPWNTGTMKRWYWWEIKNDIMKRFG